MVDQHVRTIANMPISINLFEFLFDVESVEEFREAYAEELTDEDVDGIVGIADETYPTKNGPRSQPRASCSCRTHPARTASSTLETATQLPTDTDR